MHSETLLIVNLIVGLKERIGNLVMPIKCVRHIRCSLQDSVLICM